MKTKLINESGLAECATLYSEVFNQEPWNEKWTVKSALSRLTCYQKSPNFVGVSAQIDGELIGFIIGNFEPFQSQRLYLLKEMCVRKAHQGQGVGSELLKSLHFELAEQGVNIVNLLTRVGGQAENFYLKNGYRHAQSMGLYVGETRGS